MADNLFPDDELQEEEIVQDMLEELNEAEEAAAEFYPGFSWDYKKGDFKRNAKGDLVKCTEEEAWEQWCINCLLTESDTYDAYGSFFGIELDKALRSEDRETAEAIIENDIQEALKQDPYGRTESVRVNSFVWEKTDTLIANVEVTSTDETTINFDTNIKL